MAAMTAEVAGDHGPDDRSQPGDAEGGSDLLAHVEDACGDACLGHVDPGYRQGGELDRHQADAERRDQDRPEHVAQVRRVLRQLGELEKAAGGERGTGRLPGSRSVISWSYVGGSGIRP